MAARDRLRGVKTLQVTGVLEEFEKDDVKKDVDIISLFHSFGVELKKKGKSHVALCPWHEDKNPSLSVDKDKGLYNCFGCGESGDIFTLVEKMKGYNFKEALAFLKDFSSSSLAAPFDTKGAEPLKAPVSRAQKEIASPLARNDKESAGGPGSVTLAAITEYYHKRLCTNSKARDYLKSRGLDNPELIRRFNIGFADNSLLEKISKNQKEELVTLGILRKHTSPSGAESIIEHFHNCITFPITDEMGQVVGIYGRAVEEPHPGLPLVKGKEKFKGISHLYLAGKHKSVFNRKASKVYDEIILTESIIDCLSLIQLGFENVQSIYGTNGFTDEHLQILKDYRVKTVVLAFDADQPGQKASEKLKEKLISEGFGIKVVSSQEGAKDWNEYLTGQGTKEAVKNLIDNAESVIPQKDTSFKVSKNHTGTVFTSGEISYRITGAKEIFVTNLRVNIKAEIREDKRRSH